MIDWFSFGVGAFAAAASLALLGRVSHTAGTCRYEDAGLLSTRRCTLAVKPSCTSRCCMSHCRLVCRCDEPLELAP